MTVTPGRLSSQASGVSTNTPVNRSKPKQVQHAESDREQNRADDRLTGVHVDRDREPRGQGQNGAGHVGADDRVSGRHEDFRFAGVDHLGDEFRRDEIRHETSFYVRCVLQTCLSNRHANCRAGVRHCPRFGAFGAEKHPCLRACADIAGLDAKRATRRLSLRCTKFYRRRLNSMQRGQNREKISTISYTYVMARSLLA